MYKNKLVLIRHGESLWNNENKFTGWHDINLSKKGKQEAKEAGKKLKNENLFFDHAYTSFLKRSIHTLWYILKELDLCWIPVIKSWKLNERHYGLLQGLNKNEVKKKYGKEIVEQWRRSFSISPPPLSKKSKHYPGNELKYKNLDIKDIPVTESLKDTSKRVISYWEKEILPNIKKKKNIILVAHGNSLRSLVKYLDNLSEQEIFGLDIPTGIPIIYKFDENLLPVEKKILNV